jgi:hypothetical protein
VQRKVVNIFQAGGAQETEGIVVEVWFFNDAKQPEMIRQKMGPQKMSPRKMS